MITLGSQEIKDSLLERFTYENKKLVNGVLKIDIPCILCTLYGEEFSFCLNCPLKEFESGYVLGCIKYLLNNTQYIPEIFLELEDTHIMWDKEDDKDAKQVLDSIKKEIKTWKVKST